MRMTWLGILGLFWACFQVAAVGSAEISVEKMDHGVAVKFDGKPFTEYLVRSGQKPILWPVIGPTGKAMTRSFPMNSTPPAFEKRDHPHQRSFWFTHGEVNGTDFWSEGAKAGTIRHREFTKVEGGRAATIATTNDWLDRDGRKVCEDERTLRFGADDAARWIDFDVTVKAGETPVEFGDTKEGSFGVRLWETMKVEAKQGGKIVNSEGLTDAATWGKPAAWVDYHGPVDGERLGIAILNHPASFRYPTTWHVRTYGLFAANPFGLRDFTGKSDVSGAHTIKPRDNMTLRYRVVLHKGDEKEGKIAERFEEYRR
jgi:hypothetical protein